MLLLVLLSGSLSRAFSFSPPRIFVEATRRATPVIKDIEGAAQKINMFALRSSSNSDDANPSSSSSSNYYEYKDDCFGFLSFGAGAGTGDVVFAGIFVTLSLLAATATRLRLFPPDVKRPTIVDRRYPGGVAAVTWLLTSTPAVNDALRHTASDTFLHSTLMPVPDPNLAKMVQFILCLFSVTTAWLDIRWRDRFDYPQEFR